VCEAAQAIIASRASAAAAALPICLLGAALVIPSETAFSTAPSVTPRFTAFLTAFSTFFTVFFLALSVRHIPSQLLPPSGRSLAAFCTDFFTAFLAGTLFAAFFFTAFFVILFSADF